MSVLMTIWVVLMVLWGLASIPYPAWTPYTGPAQPFLAFLCVLILGAAVLFGVRM